MIVLNVLYTVKPGKRDEYYRRLHDIGLPQSSRAEAGNIRYDFFFAADNPNQMFLWEQWRDEAAFQEHCQTEPFLKLQEFKAEFVEHSDLNKFEV